jgi:hypothetical protein
MSTASGEQSAALGRRKAATAAPGVNEGGKHLMEHERFDALAKRLGARGSRRGLMARLGGGVAAGVLAGIGLRRSQAAAQILPCAQDGCRCTTGVLGACVPGLVCCADNPDLPGGGGTCVPPSQCFGGTCQADGIACPASCRFGANCVDCCSGFCSAAGICGGSPCRTVGCSCITGTLAPCDEGLACCPTVEGLLGGPGICVPRGICE